MPSSFYSERGRRLSVSKQAAAKTIASLQQLGYLDREVDASDGRGKRIRVTRHGYQLMAVGGASFDDVRERWDAQIGARQLDTLQARLGQLVQRRTFSADDLARFDDAHGAEADGVLETDVWQVCGKYSSGLTKHKDAKTAQLSHH